jgi:hypothetical protein
MNKINKSKPDHDYSAFVSAFIQSKRIGLPDALRFPGFSSVDRDLQPASLRFTGLRGKLAGSPTAHC